MNRITLMGVGLAAVLATGCSAVTAQPVGSAPAGVNQPGNPKAAKNDAKGEKAAPANDGTARFGKAFTWEDGLSVTVGKPSNYKPSEWAFGSDKFKSFVVFDVRVVNKTGKPWDPGLMSATMQSSNKEGERVFDSGKLPEEPRTKLLNGREVKFKMAFGVTDPKDLVLEVAPDFSHDSVIFTS